MLARCHLYVASVYSTSIISRGSLLLFFFFFQAEDGIRDLTVTGVQTCALPIYPRDAGQDPHDGLLAARIQVVRREDRRAGPARHHGDRRAERLRQVEHLRSGDRKSVV